MKRFIFIPLLFLFRSALAETQAFGGQFQGINNGDASILIGDNEAQDASNVDITDNQYGIKKRSGYSQFQTIGVSTWPVRGGYYYTDVNGNKLLVNASSTTVYKSLNSGTYSAIATTDTAGSYYDFTDSQGYLWRANSNRDEIFRYDGSNRTYYPSHPKGNQIEAMPDRLVISGTSANPNRVNFSAAADFTTFTTGILDTSAFTEDFSLPGQAINAIKYALGRLFAWTNTTTSYWTGGNQFDGIIKDVATNVGCNQPDSILYDNRKIFWQAQDKHFYSFDGNAIRKISGKITGSVANFLGGETKILSEGELADWDLGTSSQVSTSISVGDVVLSTWTDIDTSSSNFASGTLTALTTATVSGELHLDPLGQSVLRDDFSDGNFTSNPVWTEGSGGNWEISGGGLRVKSGTTSNQFIYTPSTAVFGEWKLDVSTISAGVINTFFFFIGHDSSSSSGDNCTGYGIYLDISSIQIIKGSPPCGSYSTIGTYNLFSDDYSYTATITRNAFGKINVYKDGILVSSATDTTYSSSTLCGISRNGARPGPILDNIYFPTTTVSGSILSRTFDTSLSSAAWIPSSASYTLNGGTMSFYTQSSTDGSVFESTVGWSTSTSPTSNFKRYIRYKVVFGTTTNATLYPYLSDVTLSARASTGTWTSPALTIGSAITSWGNFGTDTTLNGGTVNFAIRTATSAAMLTSASYVGVTNNTQITASTNPYAQLKFDSSITLSTQNPTVSNFTLFWNEGTLTHTFGTIDKNHRLMWSLAENGSTVNNATYIYDQRFDSWLKYSVPFDAPVRVGDSNYFGGASTGVVYIWPSGTNDAGSAITAYWKSKDFIGGDPFVEKGYNTLSLIAATQSGSSLSVDTYINGLATSTKTFTVSLTNSTLPYIRFNDRFASGTVGSFINFKFGNTAADSPFEFYSARYDYTPKVWRVLP